MRNQAQAHAARAAGDVDEKAGVGTTPAGCRLVQPVQPVADANHHGGDAIWGPIGQVNEDQDVMTGAVDAVFGGFHFAVLLQKVPKPRDLRHWAGGVRLG